MRYLGQYFLVNKSAIGKIIAALDLQSDDAIIEIGAGRGELTKPLADNCGEIGCKIIAIEKVPSLAKNLESRIKNLELNNLEILVADVLKVLPSLIHNSQFIIQKYKIVGNIPYYITGRLLRILSELPKKPKLIVLTIQKEVAERIIAQPPRMNLLAAITQFWAEPEIITLLKPQDFEPQPKVDSAIIKLATRVQPIANSDNGSNYYKFIRILFKQPRKTILNNLRSGLKFNAPEILSILKEFGLTGQERPQNLGLEMLIKLAISLENS